MEVSGQLHAPTALPPGERTPPPHRLDRMLGEPQNRSGRSGEEKISHHCPCLESNVVIKNIEYIANVMKYEKIWQ